MNTSCASNYSLRGKQNEALGQHDCVVYNNCDNVLRKSLENIQNSFNYFKHKIASNVQRRPRWQTWEKHATGNTSSASAELNSEIGSKFFKFYQRNKAFNEKELAQLKRRESVIATLYEMQQDCIQNLSASQLLHSEGNEINNTISLEEIEAIPSSENSVETLKPEPWAEKVAYITAFVCYYTQKNGSPKLPRDCLKAIDLFEPDILDMRWEDVWSLLKNSCGEFTEFSRSPSVMQRVRRAATIASQAHND